MAKFLLSIFFLSSATLFGQVYELSFDSFQESTGMQNLAPSTTMPQTEIVFLNDVMKSNSNLGPTMNFHGNVVVIDYIDFLPDGSAQIIFRREDGKDFFGHLPSMKAILRPINKSIEKTSSVVLN